MIKSDISAKSLRARKYILRFVIKHPKLSYNSISSELGLEGERGYSVGAPRETPTGQRLDGTWQETSWGYFPIFEENSYFFESAVKFVRSISKHSEFLQSVSRSGGLVALYIDVFGGKNTGDVIKPDDMALFVSTGITLGVEVFP